MNHRETMDMRERRAHPREATNMLVTYARYLNYDSYQVLGMGATLDISMSGMRLQTPQLLRPDWIPEFRIALGDEIVRVRGKIVHIEVSEGCPIHGIRFIHFAEGHQALLRQFLGRRNRHLMAA